jgi:S1-C subfamily serine protease
VIRPRLPLCDDGGMITLFEFSNALADIVASASPSLVQVQGRRRPASGVVVGETLVLTTTRALGREDRVRVRTDDGRTVDAELAGWDPATTLVLLRADDLRTAPLTRAEDPPRVGHLAIALGRSWSNAATATMGLVSVIGGPLATGRGRTIDRVIRTSAPMHSGFAGGALLDAQGRWIGVATAAEIRGLGVVIPSDIAWKVASHLAEHGTTGRGFLGVAGQAARLSDRQRDAHGKALGLLVVGVSHGSPADAGGILVGDVIVEFDGQTVESPLDLLDLLQGDRIGRPVPVKVLRGDSIAELPVTVGRRPAR